MTLATEKPIPKRPVACPHCGCSFEEHNVNSEYISKGLFQHVWSCYNCGGRWLDYEIALWNASHNNNEEEPLKPCPFCGGKKVRTSYEYRGNYEQMRVHCETCGAESPWVYVKKMGRDPEDIANVYAAWNKRSNNCGE